MPSFDVVSEVNMQEVTNAVDQVQRELATRYDFKGSKAKVELKEKESLIEVIADDQMKLGAIQELMKQKLAKRGISLKSVVFEDAEAAGGDTLRQLVKVKQGLSDEELKRLTKTVKTANLKVNTQIQGNQLRVLGKKKDDLQAAITMLKAQVTDVSLQFTNFRD